MAAADSQPPIAVAILAIAMLALLWQWIAYRRAPRPAGRMPGPAFWVGAVAWVALGLLPREALPLAGWRIPLVWLLPALGLLAATVLHWSIAELPRLREQDPPPPPPGAGTGDPAALDVDDVRLLQRLVALRQWRVADLLVPLARVATVRAASPWEEVLDRLRAGSNLRVPVLDDQGRQAIGLLDGRDLMSLLPAAGDDAGLSRSALLRASCRSLPTLRADQRATELIEALRRDGCGLAAVTDAAGQLLGFVSWNQLFQALLDRPPAEAEL
ncbi:MAG: CBS domain-containing protein [Candidatus Eisenbacteria sp.]|nr:CBS domain-containing protein [Candidatus Eisenbacteria bacterium]